MSHPFLLGMWHGFLLCVTTVPLAVGVGVVAHLLWKLIQIGWVFAA